MTQKLQCNYLETSAKLNQNVTEAFHCIMREIRKWKVEQGEAEEISLEKKKTTCLLF